MQRAWDKARACRPSIHGPPRYHDISRHTGKNNELSFEEFGRFFKDLVEKAKPAHPLDLQELHRVLSLTGPDTYIIVSDSCIDSCIPSFHRHLAGFLVLRDIFRSYVCDEEKVTALALNHLSESIAKESYHAFEKYLPLERADMAEHVAGSLVTPVMKETKNFDDDGTIVRHIYSIITAFQQYAGCKGIETDLNIETPLLDAFAAWFRDKYSTRFPPSLAPFQSRLIAVLGDSVKNSYFYSPMDFFSFDAPPARAKALHGDQIGFGDRHIAVIGMYPWEADQLQKARAMAERGIPVSKPLGRLFVDEYEFALFQWVAGTALNHISDPAVWEAYGRLIHMCHERGISPEDAAGRNAIWTGDKVTLIDFEHTWLAKTDKPLCETHRGRSLKGIRGELKDSSLLEAFEAGYSS